MPNLDTDQLARLLTLGLQLLECLGRMKPEQQERLVTHLDRVANLYAPKADQTDA